MARDYHHREHEAYAAFVGHRYQVDQQFGTLIAVIAAAALGDRQAHEAIEGELTPLEAQGWLIVATIRRGWAGERDWHTLVDDLGNRCHIPNRDALLILGVLETLAPSTEEAQSYNKLFYFLFFAYPGVTSVYRRGYRESRKRD